MGSAAPLHLYHWSAAAPTAGTCCRIITTTNRDLASWEEITTSLRWRLLVGLLWHSRISGVSSLLFQSQKMFLCFFLNANSWSPKSRINALVPGGDRIDIIDYHLPSSIYCHPKKPCQLHSGVPTLASHLLTDRQCLQQHLLSNAQ